MDGDFGFEFSDRWAYSVDVSALSIELKMIKRRRLSISVTGRSW